MRDDYQPAFPFVVPDCGHGAGYEEHPGMSLRDYFAAKAMQALISKMPIGDTLGVLGDMPPDGETREAIMENVAVSAYDYADAMLAERNKQ